MFQFFFFQTFCEAIVATKVKQEMETAKHFVHVIFVLHSSMKTHLLTNQNARNIQNIL